jgi:transcription antitermination factor NusG
MPWYVLYTAARQEKKVADRLEQLGVTVYCPMVVQVKQWSDRKKKVTVPVLPSYVFVCLPAAKRDQVFMVAGVVRYVYWLGKPAEVRQTEIDALQQHLTATVTSFQVEALPPGSKYTIPTGAFKGTQAVVTKVEKNTLFLVLEELGVKIVLRKEG